MGLTTINMYLEQGFDPINTNVLHEHSLEELKTGGA